jgi:hypothetical protein
MASISARLAVVANDTKHILKKVDEIHRDLKAHDVRLDKVEKTQAKTETSLRWMKGIFTAIQAAILAALSWFK